MNTWIEITQADYVLPVSLEPGRNYEIRIITEEPEKVKLKLGNKSIGRFYGGKLVFTTGASGNELSISSDLVSQTIRNIAVNGDNVRFETRTSGFIKLFEATDKDFTTNGIKAIQPLKIIETKKRSLNGWQIDVEVPIEYKEDIEQAMLAVVQTKSKQSPQAFRISNIEYTQRKLKFTANHVMFDAENYYIQDETTGMHNAASVLQRINTKVDRTSPYVFTSDLNMSIDHDYSGLSLLEALTLIEEQLGGSFDADNWSIKLAKNIGLDRGETIIYGKNLEDIKVFEDWSGVVTRVFPVGKDGLELPERYLDAVIQYDIPYTQKMEFSSELEKPEEGEIPLEDLVSELRANAESFLLENSKPKISYEVKSDINQALDIGDTVYVKHPLVMIDTQVQEYEYDVISGRVRKLVFGNYNRSVKKMFDKIKEDIKEVEQQTSKFEQIVNEQTDLIIGMNKFGHVYIDDNEILILDKLPKENAVNVWRWGLGGLGFSSTGYEGPFTQAWTMDGKFNTDFISAKSITANQLASDVGASLDLSSNTSINLIVSSINTKIEDIELTPGPEGPKGESGSAGADGKGITSTEIRYQKSTSGTETPTGQWQTFIPTVGESEYLWTRITLKYTTGPDSVSYTIGGVGSQGSKGDTGSDGRGISTTVVEYQKSGSGSSVPTGSWSTTLPAVLENEYLWTRTTITYTTGSPSVAYSVGRVGKDGAKGDKGEQGPRGATGTTGPRGDAGTSVEGIVEYYGLSTSEIVKPTSWVEVESEATPLPKMTSVNKYLWNYEKINFSDSTSQNTIPVVVGVYGDTGQTGQTGSTGSAGVDGRSIVSIKDKYLVTSASSGVTRSTSGWVDTPTPTDDVNKYLWNYEIITWNKAPVTTYVDPIIIGVHGLKGDTGEKGATGTRGPQGATGTSVESIVEFYGLSTSASTKPVTWIEIVSSATPFPVMTATNKYLWNYEQIKFSDLSTQDTLPVVVGVYGDKGVTGADGKPGVDGRSITGIKDKYLVTNLATGVTRSTGGWIDTPSPTTDTDKYLWNYEIVTWNKAPLETYVEPIIIGVHGVKGDKGDTGSRGATGSVGPRGDDGTSVTGIVEFYGLSTSDTVKPTSWTEIVSEATPLPKMTTTQKYLWNYEKINFSNGSNQDTVPVIVGVYGDTGDKGSTGSAGIDGRSIVSIKEKYLVTSVASGVTRSTSGWIDTPSATTDTNKYLWNYEIITWNKVPLETYVDPIIIGVHGNKGDKGATGATGATGPRGAVGTSIIGIVEYYGLSTNENTQPTSWAEITGSGTPLPKMTATNKYLWNYEKINFSDITSQDTIPVIVGVYGDKGDIGPNGQPGIDGRSISSIQDKYQVNNLASGVTRTTGTWINTPGVTTDTNKYLWNYEIINWNKAPTPTYVEPIVIGIHGTKGDKGTTGDRGPQGVAGPIGPNGLTTYNWIAYADTASGTGITGNPAGKAYVGYAFGKTSPTPVYSVAQFQTPFQLVKGADGSPGQPGIPGTPGADGRDNFTWVKYADDEVGTNMSDSPTGKQYIGFAYNKPTGTESTNHLDYEWSYAPAYFDEALSGLEGELGSVVDVVTTNSADIQINADNISNEVVQREELAGALRSEISSQVTQTAEDFTVIFNKIEADQTLTSEELAVVTSHFRVNENGVIIGNSESAIEFFAENNRVGFRENGKDIAYWEEGTMNVDNLIAIVTVIIGYHQIEKYDSPTQGKTTIVRMSD